MGRSACLTTHFQPLVEQSDLRKEAGDLSAITGHDGA
jgi:hypothetical protein